MKAETKWHDANGEILPEYEEEVIALDADGRICFAHRPDPKGWDGRSIGTGVVTHYQPKLYGNNGWNIDNVAWWMPCPEIPKELQ